MCLAMRMWGPHTYIIFKMTLLLSSYAEFREFLDWAHFCCILFLNGILNILPVTYWVMLNLIWLLFS